MNTGINSFSQSADFELWDVLKKLWRARWWIVASVVMCEVVAVWLVVVEKPIYRATVLLIPSGADRDSFGAGLGSALGQLGGLATLAGVNIGSGDGVTEEALAVLKSRQFTGVFIDDMKLAPKFFPDSWDAVANKWKGQRDRWPTPAKAYSFFDSQVRAIVKDKKTGLVSIQIEWRDRVEAAQWANELADRINSEMRFRAISKAKASVGFLEQELSKTSVLGTRDAINRLLDIQVKQIMLASVTKDYAFRVVDKAVPSDLDDPVRPKKKLYLMAGVLLGILGGVLVALGIGYFFQDRKAMLEV